MITNISKRHALRIFHINGQTVGSCECGWAIGVEGADELSRDHVSRSFTKHKETRS